MSATAQTLSIATSVYLKTSVARCFFSGTPFQTAFERRVGVKNYLLSITSILIECQCQWALSWHWIRNSTLFLNGFRQLVGWNPGGLGISHPVPIGGGVGPPCIHPLRSSIFINTSCSIRKVRLSYRGGRLGGRGWCQTLITLNTKYSIDGAGRRRHVFHVINVLPTHPIHPSCNSSTRTLFLICLIGNPLAYPPGGSAAVWEWL